MTGKIVIDVINSSIKVYDTTDWAADGINIPPDTASIFLKVQCVSASGTVTIYDNLSGGTADIIVGTDTYKEVATSIPTGPDGDVLQGEWVVTMQAEVNAASRTELETIFSYVLNYAWPKICVVPVVSCEGSTAQSTDKTDYGPYATTITRAHTLYPPPASKQANKTTSLATNIYSPIYTKTWTAEVVSEVEFTFEDEFVVIKEISGVNEFEVVCTTDMCKIMCCIRKMFAEYKKLLTQVGLAKAKAYLNDVVNPATGQICLYLLEERCGNATKAAAAITELKSITGCGECNDCGGDEPVLVIPTVPTNTNKSVIVDSPDNSITVTSTETESEITWHVTVSAVLQAIINGLKAITIDTNYPAYISVSPTTNPDGSVTWYIDLQDAAINDSIEIRYKLAATDSPAPGDPYVYGEATSIWLTGGIVQPMAIAPAFIVGETSPNINTDAAIITVYGFIHADKDQAQPFTVHAQVLRMSDVYAGTFTNAKDIEVEVFWMSLTAPSFILRFYNPIDGTPLTLSDIAAKNYPVYISLQINIKK